MTVNLPGNPASSSSTLSVSSDLAELVGANEPTQDEDPTLIDARVGTMYNRLLERLDLLDKQVADLQIDQVQSRRPWYRDITSLIAFFAFMFSFGTTLFSYSQARQQEVHNARIELRGLIQRLSELPKEDITSRQTYTDSVTLASLSGLIQQENALLAKQAAEIMSIIPEHVSSSEYLLVGNALFNSNLAEESLDMLTKATNVVQDANDGVAVFRIRGSMLFLAGDPEGGRASFEEALDIFEKYPATIMVYKATTHALTELHWAQAEAGHGLCTEGTMHLKKAKEYIDGISAWNKYNPVVQQITGQIQQTQQSMKNCMPR